MSSRIIVSKEMNIYQATGVIMEYQNSDNRFKVTVPHNDAADIQNATTI
jgi:hypothetical protein